MTADDWSRRCDEVLAAARRELMRRQMERIRLDREECGSCQGCGWVMVVHGIEDAPALGLDWCPWEGAMSCATCCGRGWVPR